MDMFQRHLFLIVCGVVAAASVALGVLGMNSMSKVTDGMQEAAGLADQLSRLASGAAPVNRRSLEAQQTRLEQLRRNYSEVVAWAREHNRHEQLLPDVFPAPTRDQKLDFRRAYQQRLRDLLQSLSAGSGASEQDVADAQVEITEEQKLATPFGVDAPPKGAPSGTSSEAAAPPETKYPSGLLTDYGARNLARARANIAKAHQFRCYALPGALEEMKLEGITPSERHMWDAQLSLWVQEPVVAALARVNERAAAEIKSAGGMVWVGVMPVKELISIRSSYYVFEADAPKAPARPGSEGYAYPPESAAEVFTHTSTNDLYDVVQFSVKLVADARKVPEIIDAICRNSLDPSCKDDLSAKCPGNFNTLLRVAYVDLSKDPGAWAMTDRVYGPAPTVQVVMDFETIFLGELYRPLLPASVREKLGLPPSPPPAE